MAKRKKVRLAKWEHTTKALSVSLTILQLGNMSIPTITNYAHASEMLTEHEQSEGNVDVNTVSHSVYAMPMAISDTNAPTMTFDYSAYSGGFLRFNEGVKLNQGTLEVWDETNQSKVITHIEAVSGHIVLMNADLHAISGRLKAGMGTDLYQLLIPNLEEGHTYSVHISSGMFADLSGNGYGGTTGSDWKFYVTDTAKVSNVWMWAGNNRAPIRPPIEFRFDKKMKLGQQGEIAIYEVGYSTPTQRLIIHDEHLSGASFTWRSPQEVAAVSGMSSIVEVIPQRDLKYNSDYYVAFSSGVFVDDGGRGTAGLSLEQLKGEGLLFRTIFDMVPPTMTFDYSNYSGGFLRFSEGVQLGQGTLEVWDETNQSKVITHIEASSGQIVLANADLHGISGRLDAGMGTDLYQLLIPDLRDGHTYSVHITSGMFEDVNGNRYEGTSQAGWSFNVADTRTPHVVYQSPSKWSVPLQPTLTLSFNKKMKLGPQGQVNIYRYGDYQPQERLSIHEGQLSGASYTWLSGTASGAFTVQMIPTHQLDENTRYYVTVTSGAFVDNLGNGMNDLMYGDNWNFRTLDQTAPTMNFNYSNYSGGWLRFNEAVELKTGTLEVWDETNQSKVQAHIEALSGQLISGQMNLRPMEYGMEDRGSNLYQLSIPSLQYGHTYSVHISSGMFADVSGNLYGGTSPTGWSFQVVDTRIPSIVDHSPVIWGTPLQPTISLSFNKKMKLGETGEVRIYRLGEWEPQERLIVHNGQLSGASYIWTSGLLTGPMSGASTIQMMPQHELDQDTIYYVTVTSGAFVDGMGKSVLDVIAPYEWTFRTHDRTAPTMTFNYNIYSGGIIEFNEAVKMQTGTLEVWDETKRSKVMTHIEAVSGRIVASNAELYGLSGQTNWDEQVNRLYYLKIPNLQEDHTYSVHISSGMFADVSGNLYAGTSQAGWSFKVFDTSFPSIVDKWPTEWRVGLTPTLVLNFNKNMKLGQQGEIQIYRYNDVTPQERLMIHNGQLSGATYSWQKDIPTVHIALQHQLDENERYRVVVSSGAFVDNLGRGLTKQYPYSWVFRTMDRTAPKLNFDYSNYSGGWLRFNEAVELKTGTLEVWDETNQSKVLTHIEAVSGRIVDSNADLSKMAYWDEDRGSNLYHLSIPNLQVDHTYSVHISSGMFADLSGNLYGSTSDSHWSFHIEDTRQPSVVALSPTRWDTSTQPTLAITFNKKMKLGQQGEVQIYRSGDDKPQERLIIHDGQLSGASYTWLSGAMMGAPSGAFTVQMLPQHQLDENKDYYVRVTSGAFVDNLGTGMNDLMYGYNWNFRTLDRTAPTMTFDYSPYSGSWLKFNEAVELKTGTLEVWDETNQSKVLTHIEAVSGRIVDSNAELSNLSRHMDGYERGSRLYQLTIPNLNEGHTYSVHISSGMFSDLSGNAYTGTTGTDWSFHVTDNGKVSRVWTWAGSNRAPIRPPIQFRFDKKMKLGQQGEIQIYEKDSATLVQRLVVHDGQLSGASFSWLSPQEVATVSGMSSIVEVIPQRDLKYNSDYYVTFSSGAFIDNVGRGTAGLSRPQSPFTLFRTIFDMVPPTMTFDYSNYSGGFLRFSEGVQLNKGTLEVWDETSQVKVVTHIEASSGAIVVGNADLHGISGRLDAGMGIDLYQLLIPNLQDGHTYSVHISSGMFADINGNHYEGTPEAGWSFKTVQSTKPDDDKKHSTTSSSTGGGDTGGSSSPSTTLPQTDSNTDRPSGSNPSVSNTGTDKTSPPASNTSMLTTPQIASSSTVSLPAPADIKGNVFVHYYDPKWEKWIAVPTTSDGTTMKADVPAGSWTSVINNDHTVKPADVVKSWAVAPVMKLMSLGIVQGDTQGNYNPKQAINRYEMAVILAKTLRLDVNTPLPNSPASSVNSPDWAQPYVQAVVNQGIMTGNSDSFNGDGQVTREQLATLIGRMLPASSATGTSGATNSAFKDAAKMSTWAVQGIAKVQALGLMKGYDDQSFRPKQAVTREEMAAVIAKVVDML